MDEQGNQQTPETNEPKGYGKRPLWQWILLYIVLGGIVYYLIYVLFLSGGDDGGNGGYLY